MFRILTAATVLCALGGVSLILWPIVPEAVALTLVACSFLSLTLALSSPKGRNARKRWLWAPFSALVLLASFHVSNNMARQEQKTASEFLHSSSSTISEILGQRINSDKLALERLAARVQRGIEDKKADWVDDAINYVRGAKEYQAIEWIDSGLHVKWVVPLKGNEAALKLDIKSGMVRQSAVDRAYREGKVTVSSTFNLVQGGRGFLIYAPVKRNGQFYGMVAGVFNIDRLMECIPPSWMKWRVVKISDGQTTIFTNIPISNSSITGQATVNLNESPWKVTVGLAPAAASNWLTRFPVAVKLFGILSAFVIAAIGLLWERSAFLGAEERQSREFLAKLTESSQSISYLIDVEKKQLTFSNRYGLEFVGRTLEKAQLSGFDGLMNVVHPDHHQALLAHFAKYETAKDDDVLELNQLVRRADGEWRWISHRDTVLSRLPNGSPKFILGTGNDVTELKEAMDRARQATAALEQIVDLAPLAMALVSTDGKWLRVNSALCDLVGYSPEEMKSINFQTITHPDDLNESLALVSSLLKGEIESYSMEKRYIAKNGQILWVIMSVASVKDANGAVVQFVSQLQDITGRKEFEESMLHSQQMLEYQSNLLTKELDKLEAENRTDNLTGAYNRRWFDERLSSMSELSQTHGFFFALILLDVDHFKAFNDTYGHTVGDDVLRFVGKILSENVRDCDLAARYGGEEFAILCGNSTVEDAMVLAERIRVALESKGQFERPITASFGVAGTTQGQSSGAEAVRAADIALYKAKEAGRNRVCLAEPGSILNSA